MGSWAPDGAGVVELADGRLVRGRGLRGARPDGPDPELGVYLIGRRPQGLAWEVHWVRCRDFSVPSSTSDAMAALRDAHRRAGDERVEVGCGGGVGRTGMALCVLAVLSGVPSAEAVAWVRDRYHPRAVETPWQRRWVARLDAVLTSD